MIILSIWTSSVNWDNWTSSWINVSLVKSSLEISLVFVFKYKFVLILVLNPGWKKLIPVKLLCNLTSWNLVPNFPNKNELPWGYPTKTVFPETHLNPKKEITPVFSLKVPKTWVTASFKNSSLTPPNLFKSVLSFSSIIPNFISKLITKFCSILLGYILFWTVLSYSKIKPWIEPSLSFKIFTSLKQSRLLQAFGVQKLKVFSCGLPTFVFSFLKIELKSILKKVAKSGSGGGFVLLLWR